MVGRIIKKIEKFIKQFGNLPLVKIGTVTADKKLSAVFQGIAILDLPVEELVTAWNKTS